MSAGANEPTEAAKKAYEARELPLKTTAEALSREIEKFAMQQLRFRGVNPVHVTLYLKVEHRSSTGFNIHEDED